MHPGNFFQHLRRYFSRQDRETQQTLPGISQAKVEDSSAITRLTIWTIFAFFLFFLLWSGLTQIDEITRAQGKAIPSSRLQKVQNLEGGIVTKLFVHEGQVVQSGEALLRLDPTRFSSNVDETDAEIRALKLRIARLNAEIQDRELLLPEDIAKLSPEVAEGEQQL
ncbi:MAG: Type I secretion system membrane fusion protein PrsE [Candidatus Erwinia impunctatus]|nr:Type I secretion system membrane fusion protein PrsE [Culicoides impunctatus]